MIMKKPTITEVILRDGQQSLIATRMKTEDMIPILKDMDKVGYSSVEVWGGATYDCCLRYLDENPWDRLKVFKKSFKNTKLQMLLRGQNLVGYKHYSDEIVSKFIEKSAINGIDIFRIFDALNDLRNIKHSVEEVKKYDCNKEKNKKLHPLTKQGKVSRCAICDSKLHWTTY